MYMSILYTLYVQIVCLCLPSHFCHENKKKICFKQDFLHWQKSINILKNNGLILKNKQKF